MAEDDYDVGYKKPPISNRFQKGTSGNPKGRPKKTKIEMSLLEKISKELNDQVTIRENGKTMKISKMEVAFKSLAANAMKGDPKSISLLMKILPELEKIQETAPRHLIISWQK